jgi:hypothetical protein
VSVHPSLIDRFVVGVDIQKYSSRSTRRQMSLQRELDRMLDAAAAAAGLDRKLWKRQPGGDGEVAELPDGIDLIAVVQRFVAELDLQLTDHNEDHEAETQIRLRVAMHIDVLTPGPFGAAGPALVTLNRLLDSSAVRAALAGSPQPSLALIISEPVYRKAVLSELGGLRARQFRAVDIDLPAKDFHETAYVYVPAPRPEASRTPAPGPKPAAGDGPGPGTAAESARTTGVSIQGGVHSQGDIKIIGGDDYG